MINFPLLCLPYVALEECLKQLNPVQLLNLSQCSKKINKITFLASRNFEVSLCFVFNRISIGTNSDYYFIELFDSPENLKAASCPKPKDMLSALLNTIKPEMKMFWSRSWMELLEYILETFHCPLHSFSSGSKFNESVIDWLLKRQSEIRDLFIEYSEIDVVLLNKILKLLKVTGELRLHTKINGEFHHDFEVWPRILKINNSSWFRLEDLLKSDCARIDLFGSSLTNRDLDVFLRKWIAGGYSKLEYLDIRSKNFNDKESIVGVPMPMEDKENQKYVDRLFGIQLVRVEEGVQIRRTDGTVGWIKMNDTYKGRQLQFLVPT